MAFTDSQVRKLRSRLKAKHVKVREAEGHTLHYLEGWQVMAEANRIFGFDGWDRETISSTCVWTKQIGARYCAAYVARVRITVRAGDHKIVREGSGAGDSNAPSPGQAHEWASKAAETDATKRALTTFGNCFGLSLYAGNRGAEHDASRFGHPQKTESPAQARQEATKPILSPPRHEQANRALIPDPDLPSHIQKSPETDKRQSAEADDCTGPRGTTRRIAPG